MTQRGISAIACYIPRTYIDRADIFEAHAWALPGLKGKSKGYQSAASWDQDTVTMGVEAARITHAAYKSCENSDISSICFASTSQPFVDRSTATIAAAALNLPSSVFATDTGHSRRAGTSALLQDLLSAHTGPALIIAAEKRIPQPGSWAEITWGDGAAAIITGDTDHVATLSGWHSIHEDYLDFYQADGFYPYQGEERWIKETVLDDQVIPTVQAALDRAGLQPGDIQWAVLPEPVPGCGKHLLRALKLDKATHLAQDLLAEIGDLGTALPLAGLTMALEKASVSDNILVTGFGNGCDALIFTLQKAVVTSTTLASQLVNRKPISYTRYATNRGYLNLDYGPRAERVEKISLSVHERVRRDFTPFIGGKVEPDAAVQFPKSVIANDRTFTGETGYIDVRLADLSARIVSISTDHLAYTPEPPFYFGLVEFDNGARLPMEFTDVLSGDIQVGDTVSMQFRIKSIDKVRGYRHYFWKASPVQTGYKK